MLNRQGALHGLLAAHVKRETNEVKVEVVVLTQDYDSMQRLENFAEREFYTLYEKH